MPDDKPAVHPINPDSKLDKFRFGVEREDLGFSNIWYAEQRGGDVYISARGTRGTTQISLHASGICHVKGRFADGNRTLSRWRRASSPVSDAVHVLSVDFPSDFVYKWKSLEKLKLNRKLFTMTAAPPGHAVEFGFFYSREAPPMLEPRLTAKGFPIVYMDLPSHEYVWVVARLTKFNPARFPQGPREISGVTSGFDEAGKIENLAMIAWTEPKDEQPVWVTNLQGLTVRRGGG